MDASVSILALSERAQMGLKIAPVALALAGKTPDQIEQIGQGSYLVNAVSACSDCHSPSPTQYLAGGVVIPLAGTYSVVSRNLTPDPGTGLKDTLAQYLQASRNGTDILNTGQALLAHPWQYERWMATSDLEAIYAFLKVIPPVSNMYGADNKPTTPAVPFPGEYNEGDVVRQLPPDTDFMDAAVPDPNFVMRGLAVVPLNINPPTDPVQQSLYGRGSYLVNAAVGCPECHSNPDRNYMSANQQVLTANYMTGGRVFPAGPLAPTVRVTRSMSANLTGAQHGFFNQPNISFQLFVETITQGAHVDDAVDGGVAPPLSYPMPYTTFRQMSLDDLQALYTYLRYVAVNAAVSGANDKVTQSAARYCASASDCFPGETCDSTATECVGGPCSVDTDCGACQTCSSMKCVAPDANSVCVAAGI